MFPVFPTSEKTNCQLRDWEGMKSNRWYGHNMSERTSLTCFILGLALVPVLGSDTGKEYLIYLPDESENIRFSAVALHVDGTEYA